MLFVHFTEISRITGRLNSMNPLEIA